jgi:hypothetical protein
MVCQECGVNTKLMGGHARPCSQYTGTESLDPEFMSEEVSEKIQAFGEAVNDAVIERGLKSVQTFLASIGIYENDPGYEELVTLARMSLAIGAGISVQILIEQDILDNEGLLRAAGL